MRCIHAAEGLTISRRGTLRGRGALFRTVGRDGKLTGNVLHPGQPFELVRRRTAAAGIAMNKARSAPAGELQPTPDAGALI
jgi:hypothetical protein